MIGRGVLASALAIALAGPPAWGHTFPPVRTAVLQVESCEVALLVGYRPASGRSTDALLVRASSLPKSLGLATLRDALTTEALAPLTLSVDGKPLVPTSVRTKLGTEGSGQRPMVVVLVTYALPSGGALSLASADARTTRISWTDRASHRVQISEAPAQGRWYDGVASFLLTLGATGGPACASSPSRSR
ncbi:MAG: hypothetical protein KF773_25795 [Deltaproteobacteria bacterium]|nr:hypothetical protein [Deltaproteobacteria bacterium]MCW5803530.1 hypothetical protein [Deltaproteobacteria bacterium]